MNIKNFLEKNINKNDFLYVAIKAFQNIVVNGTEEEKRSLLNQNLHSYFLLEVSGFSQLSDMDGGRIYRILENFREVLVNESIFVNSSGMWLYSNYEAQKREAKICDRFDQLISMKGLPHGKIENEVFKFFNYLVDPLKSNDWGVFSPKNLIESGFLKKENSLIDQLLEKALNFLKECEITISSRFIALMLSDSLMFEDLSLSKKLLNYYGNLEKNGNELLVCGVYFKDENLVDFLLPRLKHLNVDGLQIGSNFDLGFHKSHTHGDSIYEIALKAECGFSEKIKMAQEKSLLINSVKLDAKVVILSL